MKLTGKCKEDFEKWFYINDGIKQSMAQFSDLTLYAFLQLPQSMQYGVYVDFFDSVDIYITDAYLDNLFKNRYYYEVAALDGETIIEARSEVRIEVRIEAIKQANKIYNDGNN